MGSSPKGQLSLRGSITSLPPLSENHSQAWVNSLGLLLPTQDALDPPVTLWF